jgi:hypothetical protein
MAETTTEYHIETDPQGRFVKAWSSHHLRFTRTAATQDRFHDELGKAIERLNKSGVLDATYGFKEKVRNLDAENVLFYNVYPARFNKIEMDILRFKRKFDWIPECSIRLNFEAKHYVQYQVGPPKITSSLKIGHVIAHSEPVICRDITKAVHVWRSFKSAMVRDSDVTLSPDDEFDVQLIIRGSPRRNLVGIVKPLLDGFISALHDNNSSDDKVVDQVSNKLKTRSDVTRKLLSDKNCAVFGAGHRCVPRMHGKFLQWSPADDNLRAGEIIWEPATVGSEVEVQGWLKTTTQ